MIGDRLDRIACRLVREETRTNVVAPAIADLQHEASRGRVWRARGYIGVWRALGGAVLIEIAEDCGNALRAGRIRSMAGPGLLTLALTSASFAPMVWITYGRSPAPWHHDLVLFALMLPGLLAAVAPSLALPAAAALARAGVRGSTRAALLMTIMAVMTVVGAGQAVQWHLDKLRFEMFYTSNTSVRAGNQDRPLWELRRKFNDQLEALKARDARVRVRLERQQAMRHFTRFERHRYASLTLLVVPFALLGVAWSRKGRWTAAALGGGVFFAFLALRAVFERVLYVRTVFGFVTALWTPVALLFLVSVLIAIRAKGRLKPAPTTVNGRDD